MLTTFQILSWGFAVLFGGCFAILCGGLLVKARQMREIKRNGNLWRLKNRTKNYDIDHDNPGPNQSSTISVQSVAKFESRLAQFLRNNNIKQQGERND